MSAASGHDFWGKPRPVLARQRMPGHVPAYNSERRGHSLLCSRQFFRRFHLLLVTVTSDRTDANVKFFTSRPNDRMNKQSEHQEWFGKSIGLSESANVELEITESYSGRNVAIPIHVRRGIKPGPTMFVTAALHGDELNGTGAIRSLLSDSYWNLDAGTVLLLPVLNVLGFERHSRYLPDRRDLNRSFPGNSTGSMASRLARVIFDSIASRCDYGIDLHTAAVRRTNFPNVPHRL